MKRLKLRKPTRLIEIGRYFADKNGSIFYKRLFLIRDYTGQRP